MEKTCFEKLYVRVSEDAQSTPEIITSIQGEEIEKMKYEDGSWVSEDKHICLNINQCDDRAQYHYVRLENGPNGVVKVYECGICGKDFQYQYNLVRHIPIHTGARNYVCPVCQKAFRQQSTLSQHLVTHQTLKPHRCPDCPKTFGRTSTLAAHKRTHLNEKLYKCPYCGKGFNQKINLENHVHTHTGARPFKCDFCNKKFNQKSNLNCHTKSVHSNGTATPQITPAETPSPDPIPLPLLKVLKVKYKNEDNSLKDTIVTIIKSSPPKQVMDKILKNEIAFILLIENNFISPTETILKAIVIDSHEYALVRINTSDYRHIDIAWIVLRESINNKNYKMFGYENEIVRKPLIFCDDSCGVNIQQYIESRSNLTTIGQQWGFGFGGQANEQTKLLDDWLFGLINLDETQETKITEEVLLSEELSEESNDVLMKSEGATNDSDEFQIDFSCLLEDDDTPISWIPNAYLQN